jgi:hypothetical protein
MILRELRRLAGVLAALVVAAPALAGSISGPWTGDAEKDFPSTKPGVITLVNPKYPTVNPEAYIQANNMSTGWAIKDVRLQYDTTGDVMYFGLNFFGIAGDSDGNGNPGTVSSAAAARGAVDIASLGGRESITVGIDLAGTGRPQILAGVPSDKRQAGPGLDGFSVANNLRLSSGLAGSYGPSLSQFQGDLLFDPSAEHPDFIFTIKNFSKLPGYDPDRGFGLVAFAGSPDDTVEEEGVLFSRVAFGRIPEPATVLGWSVALVGIGAWRRLRRRSA